MIDSSQISFVIQGNIRPDIKKCIASVRCFFPRSKVIVSTWMGENVAGVDADEVIFNVDPGDSGNIFSPSDPKKRSHLNNLNRQIVSSLNGLKKVKTPYAVKFRPDFILKSDALLHYYNRIEKLGLKTDKKWQMFPHRILMICAANVDTTDLAYHPCDYLQFGHTQDLIELWNIPLLTHEEAQYCLIHDKVHPERQRAYQYACEQQIWLKNLDKFKIPYKKISIYHEVNSMIKECSEKIFINNLYFIDYTLADLKSRFDWMLNPKMTWPYRQSFYMKTYHKYFGRCFATVCFDYFYRSVKFFKQKRLKYAKK